MLNVEEIKARVEAATLGPWKWITKGNTVQSRAITTDTGECGTQKVICASISPKTGDAEFIKCAREDIPALITEVESLKMQLKCRTEERDQLICDLNMVNLNLDALTEQLAEKDNIIASIHAYEAAARECVRAMVDASDKGRREENRLMQQAVDLWSCKIARKGR